MLFLCVRGWRHCDAGKIVIRLWYYLIAVVLTGPIVGRFEGAMHLDANHVLHAIDGGARCTNRSYWQCFKEGALLSSGVPEDTLVRSESGLWQFEERRIYHA